MKICRDCKQEKAKDEFVKNHVFSDGIDTLCIVCNKARVKAWRKRNPEKRAIQVKKEASKSYTVNKRIRHKYGITVSDYNQIFLEQKGCCKLCGIHQTELTKRLSIDHCHSSLKVRGLLCNSCNMMLGLAKDNIRTLEKAIEYLETSQTTGY